MTDVECVTIAEDPVRPAPVISFPASGIPRTRATLRLADSLVGEWARVVVRRGEGQATKVRIHRRTWS